MLQYAGRRDKYRSPGDAKRNTIVRRTHKAAAGSARRDALVDRAREFHSFFIAFTRFLLI
jgi:hypothetical protein